MGQCSCIFVDEDISDVQIERLRPVDIDQLTRFLDSCKHPQRRTQNLLIPASKRIKPTAAKSIYQCDAKAFSPASVERSLLEVPNQVADKHLMFGDTVRIDLCRTVSPIVVALYQEKTFLRFKPTLAQIVTIWKLIPVAPIQYSTGFPLAYSR